jgi:hypothetical protein
MVKDSGLSAVNFTDAHRRAEVIYITSMMATSYIPFSSK